MVHLTSMLAQHALSIDIPRLGPGVKESALRCVLDLLGSAIAGIATAGPVAIRAASAETLGPGAASIWMSGCTASPLSALLVNGSAACALDLDDGNRSARGHPGACVIPTVLTLSSTLPRISADDVLAAIIAGYDVGVRIAAAQNPAAIATRQTGRWGPLLRPRQPEGFCERIRSPWPRLWRSPAFLRRTSAPMAARAIPG